VGWHFVYRVELHRRWSSADTPRLRQHNETWDEKMSPLSSGYGLSVSRVGDALEGSTQPPADRRSADDLETLVAALREAQELFGGVAWLHDDYEIHEPTRLDELDIGELASALRESFGELGELDEDGVELPEPSGEPEEPEENLERDVVERELERARADFEIWKNRKLH
jgi:hypothetical protein